jgi:hypothetical protein
LPEKVLTPPGYGAFMPEIRFDSGGRSPDAPHLPNPRYDQDLAAYSVTKTILDDPRESSRAVPLGAEARVQRPRRLLRLRRKLAG